MTGPTGGPTVAAYLREWIELQRFRAQPGTLRGYRSIVENYLVPRIGDVPLQELEVARLERVYTDLVLRGGRHGRPLSPTTVQGARRMLGSALQDAVRAGHVERNVARLARAPKRGADGVDPATRELQVWNVDQVRRFLRAIHADPYRELWELAVGSGMRRGELLGLRWEDVDLDERLVRVRRSLRQVGGRARLKSTKSSRARSLHVDRRVTDALAWRRQVQDREQALAGRRWCNDRGLVFTDPRGRHLPPRRITRHFARLLDRIDVPKIRLHDVRHTHATLMLEAGVSIKVVAERLGHTSVRSTLDTYAHVLPAMDDRAVEAYVTQVYGEEAPSGDVRDR